LPNIKAHAILFALPKKTKARDREEEPASDGWILFKRFAFCAIGLFFGAVAPAYWVLIRGRDWDLGATMVCVIGAGFFLLGLFGSRKLVDAADI
jgi:hypothetical protein